MKTNFCAFTLSALSCLAGTALAQPGGTYVSGLLHQPVGSAQLGTPEGRRLPVNNLGSSGQDGVEIQLNSTYGGGTGFDVSALLATPGAEIRSSRKGWDGLIYGTHRMISTGAGHIVNVYDFSQINAVEIKVQEVGPNGTVISNVNYPGPIMAIPSVPANYCSDGSVAVPVGFWVILCTNGCNPVYFWGWACPNSGEVHAYDSMRTIVTPVINPGMPPVTETGSVIVTASGLPTLTVEDASLATFGVQCYGVGQAQVSEERTQDSTGGCDQAVRRLPVRNLGSSGQDGVAIDLGPDVGGLSVQLSKGGHRGHVTLMKLTDDEGQEQRISKTVVDELPDGTTSEAINADFSGLGADGYTLTCVDAGGVVVGPSGGTAIINGGPQPVCTGRCPEGIETWQNQGTSSNPVWVFIGCEGSMNMTLPGGTVLTGVASYTITPLGSTHQGRLRHVVITKNGTELELRRVTTTPFVGASPCGTADFNGDGDIGTDSDIEAFFRVLSGGSC